MAAQTIILLMLIVMSSGMVINFPCSKYLRATKTSIGKRDHNVSSHLKTNESVRQYQNDCFVYSSSSSSLQWGISNENGNFDKEGEDLRDQNCNESCEKERRTFLCDLRVALLLGSGLYHSSPANSFSLLGDSGGKKSDQPKQVRAYDTAGLPITASIFLSKHEAGDRVLVQGLKGDPTYLIVKQAEEISSGASLESFALNAECTHLGCIVPWEPMQKKFICPCHGSQYDKNGLVLRGPAPGPLKLAQVGLEDDSGLVLLQSWTENDFRTDEKPWWL